MKTTIFYVNSFGFMSQWKGEIIEKTNDSISIRFSKNNALKFRLKDLDIDFVLVTNNPVKSLGVSVDESSQSIQFNESLKTMVLSQMSSNINYLWMDGKWVV